MKRTLDKMLQEASSNAAVAISDAQGRGPLDALEQQGGNLLYELRAWDVMMRESCRQLWEHGGSYSEEESASLKLEPAREARENETAREVDSIRRKVGELLGGQMAIVNRSVEEARRQRSLLESTRKATLDQEAANELHEERQAMGLLGGSIDDPVRSPKRRKDKKPKESASWDRKLTRSFGVQTEEESQHMAAVTSLMAEIEESWPQGVLPNGWHQADLDCFEIHAAGVHPTNIHGALGLTGSTGRGGHHPSYGPVRYDARGVHYLPLGETVNNSLPDTAGRTRAMYGVQVPHPEIGFRLTIEVHSGSGIANYLIAAIQKDEKPDPGEDEDKEKCMMLKNSREDSRLVFEVSPLERQKAREEKRLSRYDNTKGTWYFQVLRAHMPGRDLDIKYSIKCVFHTNVEELVGKLEDTLFEYQEVTAKSRNILEDIEESFDATTVGLPPRPGS